MTLYCHAIFWGTEGLGEGYVEIMQIVSCLELMANLSIFIHSGGIQPPLKNGTLFFGLRKSFKRVQCFE